MLCIHKAAGCFAVFILRRSLPSLYSDRLPCASREAAGCFTVFLLAVATLPSPCFVRLPCASNILPIRRRSLPSLYSDRLPCASREAAGCFTVFLLAVALCPALASSDCLVPATFFLFAVALCPAFTPTDCLVPAVKQPLVPLLLHLRIEGGITVPQTAQLFPVLPDTHRQTCKISCTQRRCLSNHRAVHPATENIRLKLH